MRVYCISGKARSGKDQTSAFVQEILESEGKKVLTIHFADLLKFYAKQYFQWDGNKGLEGRSLLQYIGTDVVRAQRPSYWAEAVGNFLKLFEDSWQVVLIPDTRFPNEISVLQDMGLDVVTVRVTRPNFDNGLSDEQKSHPSETALDAYSFDYTIVNNKGLDGLQEAVRTVLRQEKLI